MSDNVSDNPAVRTEQLIRSKNIHAKNGIKKYFGDDKKIKATPLEFECECSDANCGKHVKVAIDTYEKLHERNDRFTIAEGHETPEVEKVVAKKSNYDVVEKEELKP